jgi:hypothetical protein
LAQSAVEVNGNTVFIGFPIEFEFAYKNALGQIDYLKEVSTQILNFPVDVQLSVDSTARDAEEARIRELRGDPRVNRLAQRIDSKVGAVEKIDKSK